MVIRKNVISHSSKFETYQEMVLKLSTSGIHLPLFELIAMLEIAVDNMRWLNLRDHNKWKVSVIRYYRTKIMWLESRIPTKKARHQFARYITERRWERKK